MPEGMVGYDEDLYLWSQQQAAALREAARRGVNLPVDWENVAEEIESLGRSDRRRVVGHIQVVIEHLLKLEYSTRPDPRRGWRATVKRERGVLDQILADSPSLRARTAEFVAEATPKAAGFAAGSLNAHGEIEAAEAVERVGGAPYTVEQILGDWLPEETEYP